MSTQYTVRDRVAVVTLDNPPVNSLSARARRVLVDALEAAEQDPEVAGIVIRGAGRIFCGGADITEFDTPKMASAPSLWTVLEVVENCEKPVVMAMHAAAVGGGLELALAAHHRVAAAGTVLGLPEIKIGICPGAGGTQRLPRAVGLETATNMILSGNPVACEQLSQTRLLDEVVAAGELLEVACDLARRAAAGGGPYPRIRDWSIEHPDGEGFLELARMGAGDPEIQPAAQGCIKALEAAVRGPFERGLKIEFELFQALMLTPQARALRHVFLAERAAGKVAGIGPQIRRRPIERVAVIGAGTMGAGIAMTFLDAGIPVTLIETREQALDRGLEAIRGNYERSVKKASLRAEHMQERLDLLQPTLAISEVARADLVIEAVFEDYGAKEAVFRQIDALAKPGAILATNTSTLDVDRIAAVTSRREDVLGLHFFSPANVMKLLEVVRAARTHAEVLATAMALAARIGKVAVVAGVCDGFIGNRMLEQYGRQAGYLLDMGLLPQEIDRAIERFGLAMGPFRMADLAGNDISWAIRKRRLAEHPGLTYSRSADLLCEQGRFGQKSGAGWYDYRPGDRTARPSVAVEALLAEHVRSIGLPKRKVTEREIVERLLYALVNEGARVLRDGIAARASDIDLVYLNGYGFPRWRGGPMFHADSVGLYNVLRSVRRFARGYQGQSWEPAPLLIDLVEAGGTFSAAEHA